MWGMASNGVIHIVDAVVKLPTVADFVLLDENFASLEAALKIQGQPDFISILGTSNGTDPAPFTLFAPINQAFSNISATIPVNELTNILEHHIIPGNNIPSSGITNGLVSPPTLEGDVITFFISGTLISATDGAGNGDKNIIAADLQAANGVVHVIDKVLIPDTSN